MPESPSASAEGEATTAAPSLAEAPGDGRDRAPRPGRAGEGSEADPPRERTVHPSFDIGPRPLGLFRPGAWIAGSAVLFVLLVSFLHTRSFQVEEVGTRAVFTRGDFWLWGRSQWTPAQGGGAFQSLPYTEPPPGVTTGGSLRDAADAWYGMIYRVAQASQREPDIFARYDRQGAAFEGWYKGEFGGPPAMLGAMAQLRQAVKARREEIAAYQQARGEAVRAVREALSRLPEDDPSPAMRDERVLLEQFLRQMEDVVQ
ncbi:hypothetical protein L6R50_18560 [Myxococcota bacterium]|nr:hypothetical protein [Myxococcota bacterium]